VGLVAGWFLLPAAPRALLPGREMSDPGRRLDA
jgi:hypothetical protein